MLPRNNQQTKQRRVIISIIVLTALVALLFVPAIVYLDYRVTKQAACTEWGLEKNDHRAVPRPLKEAKPEEVQLNAEFSTQDTTGEYHLFARDIDYSQPVGLLVRLHGDGAWEFDNPSDLPNCLADVAASHNMILLAPKSPDPNPSGESLTWWKAIPHNRDWVTALVEETLAQHKAIDPKKIVWMGYSGGAEFITYGMLTHKSDLVTGGSMMLGGGGAPKKRLLRDLPDPARTTIPHHWYVGELDTGEDPAYPFDAVTAARRGEEFYRDNGFKETKLIELPDQDHVKMPHATILDDFLSAVETQ
ncbi:hypothetical protein QP027_00955 [Corynebacterium breve]|uniref:Alpha/beta hydrolase n=1 Tax=Corynebacterium breve TaxID=3049799 RepID=A0ABY8VKA1_9CORY|nr:hypothetical protein [Corynebacterium breve]WIM68000.1 hypothetical protein QP027_00955 [Corynebacterium breve]